jgi:2-(1,2-epoxy-1,2-dihydrophenyl)acetyl-CoA isomerase
MIYKTIAFNLIDNIAHITLNRPEAANSINIDMAIDFFHVTTYCSENPAIRAMVISSNGDIFCSGGDLKSFAVQGYDLPCYIKELTTYFHSAISRLTRMKAPVIAAVQGFAAGAGLSLVCTCDIVVAAESARFTTAYTRAGLTPDSSLTYFLPRIVGIKRAMELTLTNRVLSAQEALNWGIITQVTPDVELLTQVNNIASQLAGGPTKTFSVAKRLLRCGITETLETQMEHESEAIADIVRTTDTKEGITAFMEKRPTKFIGQ